MKLEQGRGWKAPWRGSLATFQTGISAFSFSGKPSRSLPGQVTHLENSSWQVQVRGQQDPLMPPPAAGPRVRSPSQGPQATGPLRFPLREGAAAEPAAAVGNHTPQSAGARGLGEGERINYFLGASLHFFHSQTVASPDAGHHSGEYGVGTWPQKSQRTCAPGSDKSLPAQRP